MSGCYEVELIVFIVIYTDNFWKADEAGAIL